MSLKMFICALFVWLPQCKHVEAQNTFFAASQGDMIYRGASGWAAVPGGTGTCLLQATSPTTAPAWTCDLSGMSTLRLPLQATNTFLGNSSGVTASPTPQTVSQILDTIGYDIIRPPVVGSLPIKSSTGATDTWQALLPGAEGSCLKVIGGVPDYSTICNPPFATAAQWVANSPAGLTLQNDSIWDSGALVTLTPSGVTVTPTLNTGFNFTVTLNAAGMTLANPVGAKAGQSGIIKLIQDGTGSRTITTYGGFYKFPNAGTKPALTTTAGATDVLGYFCDTASSCIMSFQADFQ